MSTNGGVTFTPSLVVDREVCPCCRTSLALGRKGEVYVAWRKVYEGNVRDIVVAKSTNRGVSWGDPVRVHHDNWVYPGCPHAGPSIAVDADNRLHVGWYTGAESGPGLYYTFSNDGGETFAERQTLYEAVPPSQVKLAADLRGNVIVSWEARTSEGPQLHLGTIDSRGRIRRLGEAAGLGRSPALAATDGLRVVAWIDPSEVLQVRVGRGGI